MVQRYDLVLGGGGVRGAAHVGAIAALEDRGWQPQRVAGVSAGAMAGALLVAGAGPDCMRELLHELDYRAFALSDIVERIARRPLVGGMLERVGRPATIAPREWIEQLLADHGVRTWADLRVADDTAPVQERHRLVVRCLDVVHRRVVRLPWDYARYGLDADEQSVALAVRASMSVPLVFDPVPLGEGAGAGLLVDGGIASGFPVSALDRRDGAAPRWPTIAVRLLPRPRSSGRPEGDLALLRAVLEAMLAAGDAMEPVGSCDELRTVRVDTSRVRSLDVRDDDGTEAELHDAGREAMEAFLDGYDHEQWVASCRHG